MRNFVNGGALLAPSSANPKLEPSLNVDERLFTAQEVAERLGVSERWVRDHATRRKPRLRAIKLGPLLRFRWSDVQALVAQQATEKPLNCR
jgi:excisionase family DNA binding protein